MWSKNKHYSINLNILECKSNILKCYIFTNICINLNILECKSSLSKELRGINSCINLNILECKFH